MLADKALELAIPDIKLYGFSEDLLERQISKHSELFTQANYPFKNNHELLDYYLLSSNKDFAFKLKEIRDDSISSNIKKAISLKIAETDISILKQLVKFFLDMRHFPLLHKKIFSLADIIWQNTNDNPLDFSYFSKRFILANILLLTFLHLSRYEDKERSEKFALYLVDQSKNFGKAKALLTKFIK